MGKSTVGRWLARMLDVPFVDTDRDIERRAAREVKDIFAAEGEAGFRQLELDCLRGLLADAAPAVIATGGGMVTAEAARMLLHTRTRCVYLHAPVERLVPRLAQDRKRPLFAGRSPREVLEALYAQRDPWYRAAAHHVVDVAGLSAGDTSTRIRDWLMQTPLPAGQP